MCEDLLGPKVKNLFLLVIFFLVWMVIAVFALVIANLFISFPSSVIPVNFEIIIAIIIGLVAKNTKTSYDSEYYCPGDAHAYDLYWDNLSY